MDASTSMGPVLHSFAYCLDFLREQGFKDEELERIRAPAGLDLGARTPEEIALSVISEIVMLRRGATGRQIHEVTGRATTPQRSRAEAPAREPAEAQP